MSAIGTRQPNSSVTIAVVVAVYVPNEWAQKLVVAVLAAAGRVVDARVDDHQVVDDLVAVGVILSPVEVGIGGVDSMDHVDGELEALAGRRAVAGIADTVRR